MEGEKAGSLGNGYNLWFYGTGKSNGVTIILEKDLVNRLENVWRISERVICVSSWRSKGLSSWKHNSNQFMISSM